MRNWILSALLLLMAAVSCQKPYVTEVELGVNYERIDLPSFEAGHCFITVFSKGSWTIALEPSVEWARLGQSGGSGIAYVRFDYDENFEATPRTVKVVVRGQGKQCEIEIIQPGT